MMPQALFELWILFVVFLSLQINQHSAHYGSVSERCLMVHDECCLNAIAAAVSQSCRMVKPSYRLNVLVGENSNSVLLYYSF